MSRYSAIKAATNAYIKTNGRQEITGGILNAVMIATINSLGKFYQFVGCANTDTDPGDIDQNVAYLASSSGTYTNLGGVELEDGEVAVIKYNGEWQKETLFNLPSKVSDLANDLGFITNAVSDLVNYYTKGETFTKAEVNAILSEYYDKDDVDSMVNALTRQSYIIAWDGTAEPIVADIPAGVVVTYNGNPYTGTLAASADTAGNIYLVRNGAGYDMYVTTDNSGYAWISIGSTSLDLSGYVTTTMLNDLDQAVVKKADVLSSMVSVSESSRIPDISFLSDAVYDKGDFIKRDGDFSSVQILSIKTDGTYGSDTSYFHCDMIVFPGEIVRVKANGNLSTRVAFVSHLNCPYSNGDYGVVAGTSVETINAGTEKLFVVPSGAVAMKVYLSTESGGVYAAMPEFVHIYRAKDAVISPQAIVIDKYGYNGTKMVYVSGATGYAFPVEQGKKYVAKIDNAGTATKYSIQTHGMMYRNEIVDASASPNSDFSTATAVLNMTATETGLWTITKYSGGAFSVSFEEVGDTIVKDADIVATAKMLKYREVDLEGMTLLNFYIALKTGLWQSSSTYKSIIYPVVPGQLIRVSPSQSNGSILIWLSADTAPVSGNLPDYLPDYPGRITMAAGSPEEVFRVPDGANFVYVYAGTSSSSYIPDYFGIAEEMSDNNSGNDVRTQTADHCAYNDKQVLLAQDRGYYFNDTYVNETSYVDTSYLDRRIADVPDGKHFIFLTDSHIDYTNFIGQKQNETPVVKFVRDRLGIRNVIFGGDAIGVQPTKYRGAKVLSIYAKEKFEAFGSDFLWVMGNHDANPFIPDGGTIYDALIDDEEIYERTSKFMENYGIAVFPEKVMRIIDESTDLLDNAGNIITPDEKRAFRAWAKLNYYYDDDTQGIRYIVLETGDAGYTLRNICNTKTDGQYSLPLVASFFVNALKSVPNGYDVVVVGHEIVDTGAFWTKVFYKILAAYKNKQSISVDFRINNDTGHPAVSPIVRRTFDSSTLNGLAVDMSRNVGSGRVFCISGHIHYDRAQIKKYVSDGDAINVENFPLSTSDVPQSLTYSPNSILHIKCDRCCATQRSSANWESLVGAYSYPNQGTGEGDVQRLGNVTEVLFDVVTITDDNRVVLTRFGAHGPVEGDKYVRDYVMPVPSA